MELSAEVSSLNALSLTLDEVSGRGGRFYLHKPSNTKLQSVTTYLNVLGHPGLDRWKEDQLNQAWMQVLQENTDEFISNNEIILPKILTAANNTFKRNSSYGARLGIAIHKYIEYELNHYLYGNLIDIDPNGTIMDGFDLNELSELSNIFMDWLEDNQMQPILTECRIANLFTYAGTIDLIAYNNKNELYIIDIKTGKRVYGEYFYQLAAYREAVWQTICHDTDLTKTHIKCMILQLRDKTVTPFLVPDADQAFYMFDNIVRLKNNMSENNSYLYNLNR